MGIRKAVPILMEPITGRSGGARACVRSAGASRSIRRFFGPGTLDPVPGTHKPGRPESPRRAPKMAPMASPRVLFIELERLEAGGTARPESVRFEDPILGRIAGWGGNALGLALLVEHARRAPGERAPLVIAVGEAVRAGLPT